MGTPNTLFDQEETIVKNLFIKFMANKTITKSEIKQLRKHFQKLKEMQPDSERYSGFATDFNRLLRNATGRRKIAEWKDLGDVYTAFISN